MPYTLEDAKREVGDSKDWLVGLEASIKKWEQRVAGDVNSYGKTANCGLCFVMNNRNLICRGCPARPICRNIEEKSDKEILQALKKLRKELDPMDCKDKCANYKPVKVERPTDHPNRIFLVAASLVVCLGCYVITGIMPRLNLPGWVEIIIYSAWGLLAGVVSAHLAGL